MLFFSSNSKKQATGERAAVSPNSSHGPFPIDIIKPGIRGAIFYDQACM